jgi:ornithine decarboxylase
MLGAYGVTMATRFNGFGAIETVACDDAPAASMFGLARRSIPSPRSEVQNVVRLSKARGRKRRKK